MLLVQKHSCESCGKEFEMIMPLAKMVCKRCGKQFFLCKECVPSTRCDWCGYPEIGQDESGHIINGQSVFF